MFKNLTTSIFIRRSTNPAACSGASKMTQSELQDLFRSELDVHNRSVMEITTRHANRRPQAYAA